MKYVLILVLTVIHSILENKDLLVLMDVLKNSTKNTDLNKKMSTWYSFLFWRKKWNIMS